MIIIWTDWSSINWSFIKAVMGLNVFSSLIFTDNNQVEIGLFTTFIAFDINLAIKMYEMR